MRWERPALAVVMSTMQALSDDIAALAADFPGWPIWHGRSSTDVCTDWRAARHRTPRRPRLPGGLLPSLAASTPAALGGQLDQQEERAKGLAA